MMSELEKLRKDIAEVLKQHEIDTANGCWMYDRNERLLRRVLALLPTQPPGEMDG